jgi:RNA polymerase sigma factor (sigma-70 family)
MNSCITQTPPFHQFDAEYLRNLKNGCSKTSEHFVEYFAAILTRKLRKYGISSASIDDICQETLVRVLAGLNGAHQLRRPECLGAFVVSVGKNVYHEFCRAGRRMSEAAANEDRFYDTALDPERRAMNSEVREQIEKTLQQLSPMDRQILVLALAEGRPRPDICRILNVKPANVPVRLHRAKARFRNLFASAATTWCGSTFAGSRGSAQGAAA